MYPLLFILLRV